MAAQPIMGLDRQWSDVPDQQVEALKAVLRGRLLRQDDTGYERARAIWNGMIDRRPAIIVQCTGTSDVMAAVQFARDRRLLLAIRGGGHNIAGNAMCEGGMVIDLSAMRAVRVDPQSRRAWVGAGATLGDVDHEAQAFGLATPLGINSTTGVAGLTLGGGFGWLSRKHGLTCDNLASAVVVTADGRRLRASADSNADLFWALRGGGGNFGVVTEFELTLHPLGPSVLAGLVVYPLGQAAGALRAYREYASRLPDDAAVWAVLRNAPPLPFLPPEAHGKGIIAFAVFWAGNPDEGQRVLDPVRRFGTPWGEHVGVMPYTAWQQVFDPLLGPGARNYWKSHNFTELSDGALDTVVDFAARVPSPQCEVFIGMLGGAIQRGKAHGGAYSQRDAQYVMNVHGRWEHPEQDRQCQGWAREFAHTMSRYASGGVYVNFLPADEPEERVRAAFGASYDRLARIKAAYDPGNLFRLNQNIKPSAPA